MSERPLWLERLSRIRRESRVVLWGLGALTLVLGVLFYLLGNTEDVPAYLVRNRVLLFALWYFCIVLTLAIVFVLLRNLLKLGLERRNRILGSKFKTKLVATYVGLSLIPVLLLFTIATELLQGSIDRWFNTPARPALEQGNAVAQELLDRVERSSTSSALRLLGEIEALDLGDDAVRARLADRVQVLRAEGDVDFLSIYEGTELVHGVVDPRSGLGVLPEPGRDLLAEAESEGRAMRWVDAPSGRGRLALAAVSASEATDESPEVEDEGRALKRVVVAGSLLDAALSERIEELLSSYQAFRQLEVQRDDLRASHLLIFLTVTLLILLASSWVGLFLARRITVPIQALAEGTKRISSGDLGHRVTVAADDELGVLVESFNRMTELLERGNLELQTSNRRLADERALLAAVLENVAAGVLSIDGSGRILTANAAALRMLRQGEHELVGRTLEEAWRDDERSKLRALVSGVDAVGSGQGVRDARETQMLLGGDWRTFEVKVTPLVDPSGGSARVVVLEELTDLIKAQQLAAWTEAARRIAHEIKNPLTPIRLAAERMLEKSRSGDRDLGRALEDGVETIVREVVAMQGMVDEFSRYARMPRPRPERVDLGKLIEETVSLYRGVKAGVEITAQVSGGGLDGGDAIDVWLDREQIRRALINLIDNAVEAVDPPGSVAVVAQKHVDGERRGARLEISVADTGRGIPAAAKDKLFLPYYSTKGRGTGMGLAIVHRIVADHQGTIRVEDREPKGSLFTIELPLG